LAQPDKPQAMRREPIDWQVAHARLLAAQEMLREMDTPGDETLRAILHERALALAGAKTEDAPAEIVELIVFRLGDRRYAVGIGDALESIGLAEITALPGVPPFYRGLISHGGIIYALVDLRPLAGDAIDGASAPTQAILFLSEAATIALAADAVESLVRVDAATIAAAPADSFAAIRGVTPDGVIVLDVWTLLADARLVLDDRSFGG